MSKVITAAEAAMLVHDNATLGIQGTICATVPEDLIQALAERYRTTQSPKGITLFHESGIGDGGERGCNALAQKGLIGKLYCGHVGTIPKIQKMILENEFPAFLAPQGVLAQMLRAIAGHKQGVLTTVGLHTYADPRLDGCKINEKARECEDVVELLNIHGEEQLLYRAFPIDVCFIRATTADQKGNLSIEHEPLRFDILEMATATHNSGGIVIAQVERVADAKALKPHNVVVPGFLVDYIVEGSEEGSRQIMVDAKYHPEWSGELNIPISAIEPMPLNLRKVIGRRAAFEVCKGDLVNLGIGMPEAVAAVAAEEGFSDTLTLTVEAGIVGGVPASGQAIGCAHNPESIISHVNTFDIYDGGGIDITVLGAAQVDACGNVNVSKFGDRVTGPGGFINITQSTKKIVFAGSFCAGKSQMRIGNGSLQIEQDAANKKFVKRVEQITFSGEYAAQQGKDVLFVTERAVFRLTVNGLELIEIAPGVDLEKDILAQMEFKPTISPDLKQMDTRIFMQTPMGLDPQVRKRG